MRLCILFDVGDDVEVEGRRQKLLKACNGFRDHDEHLKKFFTTDPQKTQSELFVRLRVWCFFL